MISAGNSAKGNRFPQTLHSSGEQGEDGIRPDKEGNIMGDRALIVVTDGEGEISPAIYTHWNGSDAAEIIIAAGAAGTIREDDVSYAAARVCRAFVGDDTGTTGTGIMAAPENLEPATLAKFSHGDAGVFVLNVKDGTLTQWKSGVPKDVGKVKLSR